MPHTTRFVFSLHYDSSQNRDHDITKDKMKKLRNWDSKLGKV